MVNTLNVMVVVVVMPRTTTYCANCSKPICVPTFAEQDESRWCFACLGGDVKYTQRIAARYSHITRTQETF